MLHIDSFLRVIVCALYVAAIAFSFIGALAFLGIGWAALICLAETAIPLALIAFAIMRYEPDDR